MRGIISVIAAHLMMVSADAQELKNCDSQPIAALPQCLQDNVAILSKRLLELTNRQGAGDVDKEEMNRELKALAAQLHKLNERIEELRRNIRSVSVTFCTGEYTPADCGGPRYDPRDWTVDRI